MAITVLESLCHPAFAGASVLAGWEGLGRFVTSVTVGEAPDTGHWLQGGEMVLSTAYFLREQPELCLDWLVSLAESSASCLVIKPERFLGVLPTNVLKEADRLGLPIVAVPYRVHWPMLIRPLTEMIIAADRGGERKTVPEAFVQLLARRGGFASAAQTLADLVGNPVLIEAGAEQVLGVGLPGGGDPVSSRIVSRRLSSVTRRDLARGAEAFNREQPPGYVERQLQLDGQEVRERLYPIGSRVLRATMAVLEVAPWPAPAEPALSGGWSLDETLALWSAAMALCFERLSGARERPQPERRALLRQALTAKETPRLEPEMHRILSSPGVVLVLEVVEAGPGDVVIAHYPAPGGDAIAISDRLALKVERWATLVDRRALVTELRQGIAVLLHVPPEAKLQEFLAPKVQEVMQVARSVHPGGRVRVGVGEPARTPERFRESLRQATQALAYANALGGGDQCCFYRDLGIYRVLLDLDERSGFIGYARDLLRPILAFDRERGGSLLATLQLFFDHNCDLEDTARAMFLHPNSLRYRLKQVEYLTGLRLKSVDDLTQLLLAVRLARLQSGAAGCGSLLSTAEPPRAPSTDAPQTAPKPGRRPRGLPRARPVSAVPQ